MTAQQNTITVYEHNPRWVPELQRQLQYEQVQVHSERSPEEALFAGGMSQHTLAILQLDAAPAECLRGLGKRMDLNFQLPVIVIASKQYVSLEWSIRELGVTEFLDETISGVRLARIIHWMT